MNFKHFYKVLVLFIVNMIFLSSYSQPVSYPSYNTSPKPADATGMSSNAVQLAAKMKMGINFGNTMESPVEGEWNSKITLEYVKFVKGLGFNAVRLPTGWVWSHLSDPEKMKIDPAWLARVKEVVGWCMANDMYVMLNAHGDDGWLEKNVNAANQEVINAKLKAIWEQIATTMRDFDEHLIFAGTNEPSVDNADQMAILNGYHETFIKTVRATGGKNSYRVLVVQGPSTDIIKTSQLMTPTTLPHDTVPNRLMLEVHFYGPWHFNLPKDGLYNASTKASYYWGAGNHSAIEPERNCPDGEEDDLRVEIGKIKKFVDAGIPVMLGEYATWRRSAEHGDVQIPLDTKMHNKSVEAWTTFVTKTARANGMVPFWWEIGFALDRANNVVKDQPLLDALKAGYNQSVSYVTLANRGTNLLMDGMYRFDNGSNAGQYANSGSTAQQWIMETAGNYVMLKNRATGLYLDGMYRNTNGSAAGQYSFSGSDAQYWTRETAGSYVKFKNKATGLYLDGMGIKTNGADLAQWSSSSHFNQQWSINIVGTQTAKMNSVSTDDISEEPNFSINFSPNPFVNDFKIEATKSNEPIRVIIFDITGKKVEAAESSPESAQLLMGSSLKPGLYIVQVEGVNLNFSKLFKILKK